MPLDRLVEQWVTAGIIDPAQGRQIIESTAAREPIEPPRGDVAHGSLVVEAVGYLGGAILLAGCILVATRIWDDLQTPWRVAVLGLATGLLVLGGRMVPAGTVGDRLRSVLWLAATGAGAGFLAVLAADALDLADRDVALMASTGAAALAAGLWLWHRHPLQQIALMGALAAVAAVVVDRLPAPASATGLGVFGVGLVWAFLGWGGQLTPRRLAVTLGCALAIFGAMTTAESDAGTWLTLVTIVLVLAWAVVVRDLVLLVVAAAGALLNVPQAISRWFPDSVAAGLGVVAVGAVLVALAVVIARRGDPVAATMPPWAVGSPGRGLALAAIVVTVVTAAVVVLAWT